MAEGSHGHSHGHAHEERYHFWADNGAFEVSIFEDGVPPEFRVKFKRWKGAIPTSEAVTIETDRGDGKNDVFNFREDGDFLRSTSSIPEPHEFVGTVTIGGKKYRFNQREHVHTPIVKRLFGAVVTAFTAF